jgi:uncharacterized protein YpuA (DUF1002 family)
MTAHRIKSRDGRLGLWHALAVACVAAVLACLLMPGTVHAAGERIIILGADLSAAQRGEMLTLFKVKEGEVPILTVTNAEEREYLTGVVPSAQIGTRAISSVFVRVKNDGSGINVQTKNITYVTERAYANALVTAGISGADIFAAAPFPVSGTAALTGVFKAFEQVTGEPIPEDAKQVATEELVETSEIGEQVGDPGKVAELVRLAKEEVVRRGLDDPAAIRMVVMEISVRLGLDLTEAQIDRLVELLRKVGGLNLDIETIQKQLKDFQDSIGLTDEQARSIWKAISDFFVSIWRAIFG